MHRLEQSPRLCLLLCLALGECVHCAPEVAELELVPKCTLYRGDEGVLPVSCVDTSDYVGDVLFYKDGRLQSTQPKHVAGQAETVYEVPVKDRGGVHNLSCRAGNRTSPAITLHYVSRPLLVVSRTFLAPAQSVVVHCQFELAPREDPYFVVEYYVNFTNIATISVLEQAGRNLTERRVKFDNTVPGMRAELALSSGENSISITRTGEVFAPGTTYSCNLGDGRQITYRSDTVRLNQYTAGTGAAPPPTLTPLHAALLLLCLTSGWLFARTA